MSKERARWAGREIFMLVFYRSGICDVTGGRRRSRLRRKRCSPRNTSDLLLVFFWLHWARGIVVHQPGVQPVPLPCKRGVLTTDPPGRSRDDGLHTPSN